MWQKGNTGPQGPQGSAGKGGANGKTSYFHIKYSPVANPTSASQMTETPDTYIGRVRTGAGTNYRAKTYKELSANARKNAYSNGNLKKGTRVTCMATRMIGKDIWMQIPLGWIAARYGGKVYVG